MKRRELVGCIRKSEGRMELEGQEGKFGKEKRATSYSLSQLMG
jgi:hypothetical protein